MLAREMIEELIEVHKLLVKDERYGLSGISERLSVGAATAGLSEGAMWMEKGWSNWGRLFPPALHHV